jgi:hypothetical protein
MVRHSRNAEREGGNLSFGSARFACQRRLRLLLLNAVDSSGRRNRLARYDFAVPEIVPFSDKNLVVNITKRKSDTDDFGRNM